MALPGLFFIQKGMAMKILSWFILAIFLVLAGCASVNPPNYQSARLVAAPTDPGTSPTAAFDNDATLRSWNKYNLFFYKVASF